MKNLIVSINFLFNNSSLFFHLSELLLELLVPMTPHHLDAVLQLLGVVDTLPGPHLPVEVSYLILEPIHLEKIYIIYCTDELTDLMVNIETRDREGHVDCHLPDLKLPVTESSANRT